MKKLLTMFVMSLVLGVCAPSYGYLLIYQVTGAFQGFDATANKAKYIGIHGFLFLDMNDANQMPVEAELSLYGVNYKLQKKYFVEPLTSDAASDWDIKGKFVTLDLLDNQAPFDYEITLTGKITNRNVGLGAGNKKEVASSLRGVIISRQGIIFDVDQSLFGSGSVSMTFYAEGTIYYNKRGATIDEVIADFRKYYTANHYHEIVIED